MPRDIKELVRRIALWSLVCFIVVYAYYQSRAVISGPQITLMHPVQGVTVNAALIPVEGVATHAKELTLNGRPIFVDLEGRFAESLLLHPGYNIIELTARDAQGRTIRDTREVVYLASTDTEITP
jgi:Glucodextranase, domain B